MTHDERIAQAQRLNDEALEKLALAKVQLGRQRERLEAHQALTNRAGYLQEETSRLLEKAHAVMDEAEAFSSAAKSLTSEAERLFARARAIFDKAKREGGG